MFNQGQFEEFNINENILINLASDEQLIYKLKRVYFSKFGKLFQVFIFISPLIVLMIILYVLVKIGYGDIGIMIFLVSFVAIFCYVKIPMKYIFSPLSYSIYITNKNFYFIEEKWKSERIFYVIELNYITVINSRIKKEKNQNQERGQLEFIYNNAERIYIVIPKIRNVSRIKKILETIIWQNSNRKERLIQFEKNIDKDEDILSAYFPKKQTLQIIPFLASIYIAGIIMIYLISHITPFLESISYVFLFLILSVFIIFFLILFLISPPAKFIFTNEKIIVKFRKKLCFSFYNNILKSVCNLNGEIQEIQIYFKETLKGDCIKSENKYLELYPPRTLRIFEILKYLSKKI